MDPIQYVYQLPVTKQNRFLPINTINIVLFCSVKIAAIKTLIIRAIIAQYKKIINGRLPDSQPVFMTHISVTTSEQTGGDVY